MVGVVSSSVVVVTGGGDVLGTGLVGVILVRGGRPRCRPRVLERVTLGAGTARVEYPGRPLGLPRGLPRDLVPLSALVRWAKLLRLLSSSLTGRYLSSGGVDPDGIGERGLWGMYGTSESSNDVCAEVPVCCSGGLFRLKLLRKSVNSGLNNSGMEPAVKEP